MDCLILFCLDFLQVILCHHHIFSFFVFVPLNDVIRAHFLITVAAVFFILDTRFALLVKLVKVDIIVNRSLI